MLIIDTETTGLKGGPQDLVVEIGICSLDESTGKIEPVYSEIVRYPDIMEREKVRPSWVFANTDLTPESVLTAPKDAATVAEEVRDIVVAHNVTSYNVPFDFHKFLFKEPWNLRELVRIPYDIMDLATAEVRRRAENGLIPDKALQSRLLSDWSVQPDKWVRSLDAYKVLCPEDPAGRHGKQSHRALDDTIMEAHVLYEALRSREVPQ